MENALSVTFRFLLFLLIGPLLLNAVAPEALEFSAFPLGAVAQGQVVANIDSTTMR